MKDYLVKKLQTQLNHIQRQIEHYTKMMSKSDDDDAKIIYDIELHYWRGQYDAMRTASEIIQEATVTGGTPF
jgi:hypothetical protein